MFTNKNKQSQTHYAVDNSTVGDLVNNYSFGGIDGFAMAAVLAIQAGMLFANYTLAKDYYDTNKKDFDFFKNVYQTKMAPALAEAITRPFYLPDYPSNTGRGVAKGQVTLDRQWFQTRRALGKYHVGLGRRVDYKYAMAKFNAELDGANLGLRYEDTRKQKYDEQRHAHQTEILNLGISAGNTARAGLATSMGTLMDARDQLSSQLSNIGNGFFESRAQQSTVQGASKVSPVQLANATKSISGGMGGVRAEG